MRCGSAALFHCKPTVNTNKEKKDQDEQCLVIEHPHVAAESHYDIDMRCDGCSVVNPDGGEIDEECPVCGAGTLQDDAIGEILFSSEDDRTCARIVLRASESQEFLLQLDRVLRDNFDVHIRALSAASALGGAFPACTCK